MGKHSIGSFVSLGVVDGLILIVTLFGFWEKIVPGNIVGIVFVFLFIVNGFIIAWLFDVLESMFKSLGDMFSNMGGFLGR
jgi:hypothetical protein